HSILMKEPERAIQPFPAPPLPSEALALTGSGQVAPNLLLHPVSDIRETPAGVADRKVVHPAAQNGIDLLDQLLHGLRAISSEDQLELAQQCRPLLASRRTQRHPSSPPTADATELKPQKSETLSLLKIHLPALLLVHLNLQLGQLLLAVAFPPPCEAPPAEDERRPGPPHHRHSWRTR